MAGYRDPLPDDLKELISLCRAGRLFDVQRWIEAGKRFMPPPGKFATSPLRASIEKGFHSIVEVLVKAGGSREQLDQALGYAVRASRLDIVELLAAQGASIAQVSSDEVLSTRNPSIIRWFVDHGLDMEDGLPIAHAFRYRHREFLGIYMGIRGKVPSARKQAAMALRVHCREGNLKWVSLEMVEKVERTEIPPEPGETRWWKKYEHAPTGGFTIRLIGYFQERIRQSWSDGKVQKLDSLLPEVLTGISVAAEQQRSRRLEREEREKRWAEEKRIREEQAARITLERERRTRLTEAVNGWHRAEKIRQFCEEVEKSLQNGSLEGNDATKWLAWARGIALKSDPFENGYFQDALSDKGLDSSLNCD